jgi:hypothetical protein
MELYIIDVVDNRNMQRALALMIPDDYPEHILRKITITNASKMCGGFKNVKRARLIKDGHKFVLHGK